MHDGSSLMTDCSIKVLKILAEAKMNFIVLLSVFGKAFSTESNLVSKIKALANGKQIALHKFNNGLKQSFPRQFQNRMNKVRDFYGSPVLIFFRL